MNRLQIKNIRIIDPSSRDGELFGDIFIEGKTIVSKSFKNADKIINGENKIAIPGIIDVHAHLREPGQEAKETIYTGTRSAAKGGITSIFCMPNTDPVIDNTAIVEFVLHKAHTEGCVNVFPIGCATKGSRGVELSEIGLLKKAGIIAVSDDGFSIANSRVMRRVLEYSKMFKIPVISHSEDSELAKNGVMNEGKNSTFLGLRGIPKQAEEIIVSRDIMLAELTGARLHVAHVSTAGSVDLIRQAKRKKINVTAETCPHYFTLTDNDVKIYDANTKVNPPLRSKKDVEAIKDGLADGTIDCIATDHAPHTQEEKNREFDLAPFGIIGFETLLSLVLNELVYTGILSFHDAISKITHNPAKIFNLTNRGTLKNGSIADVTIIDAERLYKFDIEKIISKSKNSPFIGREFRGLVTTTIVGGNIAWDINGTHI
ncbi:MAG: dihydroorotase [Endomicrobium sp.]|jgi:dihydroorotase|nr:dihydroorotase [Endomicrobium sp.]